MKFYNLVADNFVKIIVKGRERLKLVVIMMACNGLKAIDNAQLATDGPNNGCCQCWLSQGRYGIPIVRKKGTIATEKSDES